MLIPLNFIEKKSLILHPLNDTLLMPVHPLHREISETTPPASPSLTRRREENVFSRLTSGTAATNLALPGRYVPCSIVQDMQEKKCTQLNYIY